jgi:hypothetical protein
MSVDFSDTIALITAIIPIMVLIYVLGFVFGGFKK